MLQDQLPIAAFPVYCTRSVLLKFVAGALLSRMTGLVLKCSKCKSTYLIVSENSIVMVVIYSPEKEKEEPLAGRIFLSGTAWKCSLMMMMRVLQN